MAALLRRALETTVIALMVALAVVVVVGVGFRKLGQSLVWYDEVASQLLAWLTYTGAALAALTGAHVGVPTLVAKLRGRTRLAAIVLAEIVVFGFLAVLTYAGIKVTGSLSGVTLTSLPQVPRALVQAVIPIGGVLFIMAEALRLAAGKAGDLDRTGDPDQEGGAPAEERGATARGSSPGEAGAGA